MFETRPNRSSEVVLAGRSNVGKSTLMAELTGHTVDTGQRPGVTRAPNHYDWVQEDFVLTDLPGFGFMSGVPDDVREEIKTDIVRYAEENADAMLAAVIVLDGNAALEIIDRHQDRGEVPHVLDMDTLFRDLGVPVVLAVNKMDKVEDRDAELDAIAERFGLHPPWQQWRDTIAPITAKRGAIDPLTDALGEQFKAANRHDLLGLF